MLRLQTNNIHHRVCNYIYTSYRAKKNHANSRVIFRGYLQDRVDINATPSNKLPYPESQG